MKQPQELEQNFPMAEFHAGDKKSFEKLYNLYFDKLCAKAKAYDFGREYEAEDIVQESMIKLSKLDPKNFATINRIRQFLFTVTTNACIDKFREKKRQEKNRRLIAPGFITEINSVTPDRLLENKNDIQQFSRAFDTLPENQKNVLSLVAEGGYKYKEVAQVFDISINTARGISRYARINLKKALNNDLPSTVNQLLTGKSKSIQKFDQVPNLNKDATLSHPLENPMNSTTAGTEENFRGSDALRGVTEEKIVSLKKQLKETDPEKIWHAVDYLGAKHKKSASGLASLTGVAMLYPFHRKQKDVWKAPSAATVIKLFQTLEEDLDKLPEYATAEIPAVVNKSVREKKTKITSQPPAFEKPVIAKETALPSAAALSRPVILTGALTRSWPELVEPVEALARYGGRIDPYTPGNDAESGHGTMKTLLDNAIHGTDLLELWHFCDYNLVKLVACATAIKEELLSCDDIFDAVYKDKFSKLSSDDILKRVREPYPDFGIYQAPPQAGLSTSWTLTDDQNEKAAAVLLQTLKTMSPGQLNEFAQILKIPAFTDKPSLPEEKPLQNNEPEKTPAAKPVVTPRPVSAKKPLKPEFMSPFEETMTQTEPKALWHAIDFLAAKHNLTIYKLCMLTDIPTLYPYARTKDGEDIRPTPKKMIKIFTALQENPDDLSSYLEAEISHPGEKTKLLLSEIMAQASPKELWHAVDFLTAKHSLTIKKLSKLAGTTNLSFCHRTKDDNDLPPSVNTMTKVITALKENPEDLPTYFTADIVRPEEKIPAPLSAKRC